MGFLKGFFSKFFRTNDIFSDEEFWENDEKNEAKEPQEYEWDWESITKQRSLFKVSDPLQREKYIRSLIEQVKDASGELDKLSYEYNMVTAYLKDMDELDALPKEEKDKICDCAGRMIYFEKEKQEYQEKKNRMSDRDFYHCEQIAENMPKAYEDIKEAEDYKALIKEDLNKLDGEKHAFFYRRDELLRDIGNCKGMVLICLFAMVLCVIMLLIMQLGFSMETKLGYLVTVLAGACAMTFLYIRYLDFSHELIKSEKSMNRVILLQNTVKIRYVNNANLLDYLYMKYNTKSARELKHKFDQYETEIRERNQNRQNEEELTFYQDELLKVLRKFQLSDARTWVHQPRALLDSREMVEIRHEYIIRRQKLRARIDYNKRLAKEGEKELKEFSKNYTQYAKEVIDLMGRY